MSRSPVNDDEDAADVEMSDGDEKKSVLDPLHKLHRLVLVEKAYKSGSFGCNRCGKLSKGPSYHCALCSFDLHPQCLSSNEEQKETALVDNRPVCPYDARCYRTNPQHIAEMQHPIKDAALLAKQQLSSAQDDENEEEDMDDENEADDDEADDNDAPNVAGDVNEDEDDNTDEEKPDIDYTMSAKYAWLPTDVTVNTDGTVSIDSYINNLHPKRHRDLYGVLERIFARFVPLFNRVLTDLRHPRDARVEPGNWWGPELELDDSDEDDLMQDYFERRGFIPPDAPTFFTPALPTSIVDLRGHKLQVIVKLANIVLSPDKPKYDGGVWHVEGTLTRITLYCMRVCYDKLIINIDFAFPRILGMKNEDIVSTGFAHITHTHTLT